MKSNKERIHHKMWSYLPHRPRMAWLFTLNLSVFFFSSRRRHTRYIGDWSSDVCSSDLDAVFCRCQATVGRINFALFSVRSIKCIPRFLARLQPPIQRRPAFRLRRRSDKEDIAMSFRRDFITKPIFALARTALPPMSDTEREAIEAGDVWWDADLFTGNPDWAKLLAFPPARLSKEEQAFLDGPVDELCRMLDEWRINWELHDLPPEVWDYLKTHKFFAMIIPKAYGGLGFSAYAHSEVIRKLSTRSISVAVTAMVPNSLGPGELLLQFCSKAQQDYWLPRLADAREIPCFGLTSPEAGSDAASMVDSGIVCRGTYQGREIVGIKLNWHKRYITLGPIATVLGLAFKLYDP